MPLPREIRELNGYSPSLSLMIGADVMRHVNDKWAVQTGLKLETKGMTARATVKGYQIAMVISDGDHTGSVDGVFTGKVRTTAKNSYLTVPFVAVYKPAPRWDINAGFFVGVLLEGDFNGEAHDGYIRDGGPTGEKVGVSAASYDFSDEIRRINWGTQIGGRWQAYRHFSVFGDLTWALNSIFKKDFDSISFDMYNVYFNVGFAYTF